MSFKVLYILLLSLFFYRQSAAQYGPGYKETGVISYFTDKVADRTTANGEKFDNEALVAGHNKIPFNSKVKVTNLANGKSVIVRINDLVYAYGRIMDISKAAARKIGLISTGTAKAKIEVIDDRRPTILAEEEPEDLEEESNENVEETTSTSTRSFEVGNTYSQWGSLRTPGGYCVQTAGFGTSEAALNYCKFLRNNGLENEKIFIQVVRRNEVKFFKVVVGEFDRALDTSDLKTLIKTKTGRSCFTTTHLKIN